MKDKKTTPTLTTSQKTNLETAKIEWLELQRHFALGLLVIVEENQDLVEIAADFIDDNSARIKALLDTGKIRKAETDDARQWNQTSPVFWAVVAAPWVLVQHAE